MIKRSLFESEAVIIALKIFYKPSFSELYNTVENRKSVIK